MGRYNIDGGRFGVKLTLATRNHLLGLNVAFPPRFSFILINFPFSFSFRS